MITLYTKPVPVNQKYGVQRGKMVLSKKYRETKAALKQEMWALNSPNQPLEEEVAVNIIFFFGNKRANDIDNCIKILLDAAEGVLFKNDSQVTELHVFKEYCKEDPRIEISVI
jgi:Holliday junction resolvase RusA-like endonuclease